MCFAFEAIIPFLFFLVNTLILWQNRKLWTLRHVSAPSISGQRRLSRRSSLNQKRFPYSFCGPLWLGPSRSSSSSSMCEVPSRTRHPSWTGEVLLYDIYGEEKRTIVPWEKISDSIKRATLVTEDNSFYEHRGFDIQGILRSVLRNVEQGYGSSGGSTITQQLVGNALVGREKNLTRKLQELILSIEIERQFSKDQIFWMEPDLFRDPSVGPLCRSGGAPGVARTASVVFVSLWFPCSRTHGAQGLCAVSDAAAWIHHPGGVRSGKRREA